MQEAGADLGGWELSLQGLVEVPALDAGRPGKLTAVGILLGILAAADFREPSSNSETPREHGALSHIQVYLNLARS